MARKYYGNIETISGTSYQVEIWDDPSGLATGGTELNLANEGLSFAYDGNGNTLWDGNMQSSRATAQFIVTETVDHTFFQDLAVEYENKAALIIYKDNVLHYVGRILPDQMQYERRPELNTIYTIVGVDGIALLDNYKVDYNWFNSTTERLSILQLIRQSIQETNLHAYYDHLGYADEFLIDASLQFPSGATAPNEYLNYLEINWASSLSDLESYMNLNSTEGSPRLYKKTSDIINELLRTLGCRLIYSNGYFWIYDPIMLANNTGTNYIKYATDGSRVSKEAYTIQMAVDDGQRPCFAAFPIRSHQPPVRYISQTFDRVSFNRVIREFSNQSTSVLELRTPSIGWVSGEERSLFVRSQIKFAAQSFTGTPPMQTFSEINFRIYVDIGFGTNPYLVYDYQTQTWTPAATKPFFEKVRCDVADAEVVNSRITIFTIDFDREFEPPNYEDEVVIEISVGNLQWNFTSGSITNAVQFWGSLYMVERDQTQRSITATNTKNTGAAEVVELDSTYGYNFTGYSLKGVGTIWNSNTGGASQISMGDWAENQLAVYVEAPLLMTGQLVDAGNYFPTKIAYLDSDAFIFNGGTFNAQSETWDLELLKIAQDVTSVTLSYDDYVDYIDLNDQQGDSLRRSLLQTNQLRESVSNIPNWMQYDIIRLSPNSPTSTPSQSTDFNVKINYNPTDNILSWDIQELGKSDTVTSDETVTDTSVQIFDVDTALGSINLTLPTPSDVKGREYIVKKSHAANTVTVTGTIDGSGSYLLDYENESVVLISNGLEYVVKSEYGKDDLTDVTNRNNTTENTVGVGALQLDLTPSATPTAGMIYWDGDEETAAIQVNGLNYEIGQGLYWVAKNQTGVTINKGTAVYASGTLGASGRILISPMIADGTIEAKYFLGITAEDIANGDDGKVITQGKVRQIDTSGYTAGDVLWVSSSTAGALTSTQPTGSNLALAVAFVVESASNGVLAVRVSVLDENAIGGTTPTLDEVTTAGNTTTNDIEVGGLNVDSGTLYVDSTNNRVGIGETSVDARLHITSSGAVVNQKFESNGVAAWRLGIPNGQTYFAFDNTADALTSPKVAIASTGNVLIGTTVDNGSGLRVFSTGNGELEVERSGGAQINLQAQAARGVIGTDSNHELHLKTNSTARVTINTAGRVGIGTTSPAKTLSVVGAPYEPISWQRTSQTTGYLYSDSAGVGMYTGSSFSQAGIYMVANTSVDFRVNGAQRMYINSSGNVGIGTTSPSEKLHVKGKITVESDTATVPTITITDINNAFQAGLSSTGNLALRASTGMLFYTGGTVNRMTITNTGNVGIGTTSPGAKVHIGSSTLLSGYTPTTTTLAISDTTNGAELILRGQSPRIWFDATASGSGEIYMDGTNLTILSGNPTSVGSSRLYINSSGNVGIGTSSPSRPISVQGSSTSIIAEFKYTAAGYSSIDIANTVGVARLSSVNNDLLLSPGGAEKMRVKSNGNVLIGTTTDAGYKLNVNGKIAMLSDGTLLWGSAFDFGKLTYDTGKAIVRGASGKALSLGANNTQDTIYINTSQNVGIGTTSPTQKLSVAGKISSDSNNNYYGAWLDGNTSSGSDNKLGLGTWYNNAGYVTFIQSGTPHRLKIHTSNTADHITLQEDGGNVGIGTTSPETKLHVQETNAGSAGGMLYLKNSTESSGTYTGIYFGTWGKKSGIFHKQGSYGGYGKGDIIFATNTASDGTVVSPTDSRMVITNGGNVGIGTSSPSRRLSVYQASSSIVADFRSASGNNSFITLSNNTSTADQIRIGSASNDLTLSTNYTERMRITNGGNVLIGTTTDSGYKLDVNGNVIARNTYPSIYVDHSGTTLGGIRADATNKLELKTLTTAPLSFQVNSSDKMRITTTGVGISNTSPAYNLDVTGDINASSNYYHNGVQGYTGTVTIQQPAPNPPINIDINGGIITNVY